uniref:Uncharacterized protein n=1 Tax=Mandrillus leucophaeus TaxID=9568 RepID=A0A2K6A225_MANLE
MSVVILTRDDEPRIFTTDSDAASPALHSTYPLPDPASASPLHREEKILPKDCNIISCLSFSLPASPTDSGLASPTTTGDSVVSKSQLELSSRPTQTEPGAWSPRFGRCSAQPQPQVDFPPAENTCSG